MRIWTSLFLLPAYFFIPTNPCAATSGTTPSTDTTTTTTSAPTTTSSSTTTTAAATTACQTCTAALITIVTGNDGDQTPTSSLGTDANDCATITYTCERNPVVATDVVLITYYSDSANPTDVGTEDGTGSVTATLTCVDGHWENAGIEINDIECQIIT